MLSQIDRKKIKSKFTSIYRSSISKKDTNYYCNEILQLLTDFNKKKNKKKRLFLKKPQ